MLDECALLLDEVGYEALTTKEVARRAEVPIGTFYQFFPDKQGLVRALALRNLEAFLGPDHLPAGRRAGCRTGPTLVDLVDRRVRAR